MFEPFEINQLTNSMAALWRAPQAITRASVLINNTVRDSEISKLANMRPWELSARLTSEGITTRSATSVATTFPQRVHPHLFTVVATSAPSNVPVQARGVFLSDVGAEAGLDPKNRGSRFERLLQTVYDQKTFPISAAINAEMCRDLLRVYAPDALKMATSMVTLLLENNVRLVRSQVRLLEQPIEDNGEGRPRMLAIPDWIGCVLPESYHKDAVVATVELKTATDNTMPNIQNCVQVLYQSWLAKQTFQLEDYPPAYICQVAFSTMQVSLVKVDPIAVINFIKTLATPAPGIVIPSVTTTTPPSIPPTPVVGPSTGVAQANSVSRVPIAPTPLKQVLTRIKSEHTNAPAMVFVVGFLNMYMGKFIVTLRSVAAALARTASISRINIDGIDDTLSARAVFDAYNIKDKCNISKATWTRMLDGTDPVTINGTVTGMWSTAYMQGETLRIVTP